MRWMLVTSFHRGTPVLSVLGTFPSPHLVPEPAFGPRSPAFSFCCVSSCRECSWWRSRSCASLFWALTPWHMWQRRCLWNGTRCSPCSSPMLVGAPRTLGAGLGSGIPCYLLFSSQAKEKKGAPWYPTWKVTWSCAFQWSPWVFTDWGKLQKAWSQGHQRSIFQCSYIPWNSGLLVCIQLYFLFCFCLV